MAYVLSKDTEMHVATTAAGTYALVGGGLTIGERDEGGEDEEIYTFGSLAPIVEEGEDQATIDFTFLFDPADATGQTILRDARRNGTAVFIRMLWDGEGGTAGEQFEARVLNYSRDADRNGTGQNKYVRGSVSMQRVGAITAVVAGP